MKTIKNCLTLCLCVLTMVACNSQTGGSDVCVENVNKAQKWTDVLKTYPMLQDFPAYDYELENVQYSNSHGLEQVTYFDYKCEKSCYEEYKKKIATTSFVVISDDGDNVSYRQKKDGATLLITMSYAAGNFTCQYTKDTE